MIKILIADDSPTDTLILKKLFESEKDMSVVACAKNGREAVKLTEKFKPDLITMDIEMPLMNGYEATKLIMTQFPTPVVVISSNITDRESEATFKALESGALTVLPKPTDITSSTFNIDAMRMIETIRSMAEIKVIRRTHFTSKTSLPVLLPKAGSVYQMITIGASVGGPQALKMILSRLSADFQLPIVVVQHMTVGFMAGFIKWLGGHVKLKVKAAENGELLQPGVVYLAPDNTHFLVQKKDGKLYSMLQKSEPVAGFCPSITMLMRSVAKSCKTESIGILLTGMGTDGVDGMAELKAVGAHTLVQDEQSCVVFGMGSVAKSVGAVDKEIQVDQIADYLTRISVFSLSKKP